MRLIIITMVLLVSVIASANEQCSTLSSEESVAEQMEIKTDVPSHLKGATVCVKLADGKESCVPAEKFKVVPRKQQFIVTKTKQSSKTTCNVPADKEKNRVSLLAGQGPKPGLDVSRSSSQVTVESRTGAVGGVQYQRLVTDKISVGGQVQSNESVMVNIGLDF